MPRLSGLEVLPTSTRTFRSPGRSVENRQAYDLFAAFADCDAVVTQFAVRCALRPAEAEIEHVGLVVVDPHLRHRKAHQLSHGLQILQNVFWFEIGYFGHTFGTFLARFPR